MKKCEHKRWSKWRERSNAEGNIIVSRACKKCGWVEFQQTTYGSAKDFTNFIKKVIADTLEEQAPKTKKKK